MRRKEASESWTTGHALIRQQRLQIGFQQLQAHQTTTRAPPAHQQRCVCRQDGDGPYNPIPRASPPGRCRPNPSRDLCQPDPEAWEERDQISAVGPTLPGRSLCGSSKGENQGIGVRKPTRYPWKGQGSLAGIVRTGSPRGVGVRASTPAGVISGSCNWGKSDHPGSLTWSLLNSSQLLRRKVLLSSDQRTEKANVCWRKCCGHLGSARP